MLLLSWLIKNIVLEAIIPKYVKIRGTRENDCATPNDDGSQIYEALSLIVNEVFHYDRHLPRIK